MVITKTKLFLALLVAVLIVPATAYADHFWPDVPDDKFYTDAVEWAKANGMTTGCDGGTNFCPNDPVTRGENITFAKRYDDLVVQPALATVAVAHATVLSDGSVVAARSTGVTDANVTLESTSAFCFYDLGFDFTVVQVSPLYLYDTSDEVDTSIEIGYPDVLDGAVDCGGTDPLLEIATVDDSTWTPHGFTVTFFS